MPKVLRLLIPPPCPQLPRGHRCDTDLVVLRPKPGSSGLNGALKALTGHLSVTRSRRERVGVRAAVCDAYCNAKPHVKISPPIPVHDSVFEDRKANSGRCGRLLQKWVLSVCPDWLKSQTPQLRGPLRCLSLRTAVDAGSGTAWRDDNRSSRSSYTFVSSVS